MDVTISVYLRLIISDELITILCVHTMTRLLHHRHQVKLRGCWTRLLLWYSSCTRRCPVITDILSSLRGITGHMCFVLVPVFCFEFETLYRLLFLQLCQDGISRLDSCPGETLMGVQASAQERESGISLPLVSDLCSQCPPHISAW